MCVSLLRRPSLSCAHEKLKRKKEREKRGSNSMKLKLLLVQCWESRVWCVCMYVCVSVHSFIHQQPLTWGELWTRVNSLVLVPLSCADLPLYICTQWLECAVVFSSSFCVSVSVWINDSPPRMAFRRPATVTLVTFILLFTTFTIVIANVPTSPSVTLPTDLPTDQGSDFEWRAKLPKDLRIDVQGNNLSTGGSSNPSNHREGANPVESLRYAVASFDFNHVATPYIISLWIIIVGLAKIGKFLLNILLFFSFL